MFGGKVGAESRRIRRAHGLTEGRTKNRRTVLGTDHTKADFLIHSFMSTFPSQEQEEQRTDRMWTILLMHASHFVEAGRYMHVCNPKASQSMGRSCEACLPDSSSSGIYGLLRLLTRCGRWRWHTTLRRWVTTYRPTASSDPFGWQVSFEGYNVLANHCRSRWCHGRQ